MENKADKELGMKWFKFFTKIRSWISIVIYVLLAFSITMQLVEYLKFGSIKDVYVITIFQIVLEGGDFCASYRYQSKEGCRRGKNEGSCFSNI